MQRTASYSHPTHAVGNTRYTATSSAFSASANPNEDWTKISDLAERRRIQNRIAQRNYRKKLKRRLEDLERRAGSSSASPEQAHAELAKSTTTDALSKSQPMTRQVSSRSSTSHDQQHHSPEILPLEDHSLLFDTPSTRHFSLQSTQSFNYPSYHQQISYLPYDPHQHNAYSGASNYYPTYSYAAEAASTTLPPTLPSMLPSTLTSTYPKQDSMFADDELLNPFSLNYASLAGLELPANPAYSTASSNTSGMRDPYSLDSAQNSPSYPDSPPTPVSITPSPRLQFWDIRCN